MPFAHSFKLNEFSAENIMAYIIVSLQTLENYRYSDQMRNELAPTNSYAIRKSCIITWMFNKNHVIRYTISANKSKIFTTQNYISEDEFHKNCIPSWKINKMRSHSYFSISTERCIFITNTWIYIQRYIGVKRVGSAQTVCPLVIVYFTLYYYCKTPISFPINN